MKLFKTGDKAKDICEDCANIVPTTYAYRDMPFSDGTGVVKNILVAVCDFCDVAISVPSQSIPAINQARRKALVLLKVQVLASDMEILNVAASRIAPNATLSRLRRNLLTHYMRLYLEPPAKPAALRKIVTTCSAMHENGVPIPRKQLHLRISPSMGENLNHAAHTTGLPKTQLIRGLVHKIEADIVAPKTPKNLSKLKDLVAAADAC